LIIKVYLVYYNYNIGKLSEEDKQVDLIEVLTKEKGKEFEQLYNEKKNKDSKYKIYNNFDNDKLSYVKNEQKVNIKYEEEKEYNLDKDDDSLYKISKKYSHGNQFESRNYSKLNEENTDTDNTKRNTNNNDDINIININDNINISNSNTDDNVNFDDNYKKSFREEDNNYNDTSNKFVQIDISDDKKNNNDQYNNNNINSIGNFNILNHTKNDFTELDLNNKADKVVPFKDNYDLSIINEELTFKTNMNDKTNYMNNNKFIGDNQNESNCKLNIFNRNFIYFNLIVDATFNNEKQNKSINILDEFLLHYDEQNKQNIKMQNELNNDNFMRTSYFIPQNDNFNNDFYIKVFDLIRRFNN